MNISANTLFHFTKEYDTLVKILETKFYPRLCLEQSLLFKKKDYSWAIPMVCFCDIPLSQISEHASKYGNYAIGIKKDWAKTQGVSPIIYVHENSLVSNTIIEDALNMIDDLDKDDNIKHRLAKYIDVITMMKQYEGYDVKTKKLIRYYDEREWRYVPPREGDDDLNVFWKAEFDDIDVKGKIDKHNEKYGVSFSPDNINYIIVDKEDEVLKIKKVINDIKGDFSHKSVELLTTRILSMERIREDM